MESFLIQATVFLLAAVIAVPIAARLGLGSVLGYLVAGMAMAQLFGSFLPDFDDLRHVAEFGVVMMLFLIGLELEPRAVWEMRHRLLGLGLTQIVLTAVAIGGAAIWLGYDIGVSIALGVIFSLSSTAIVLQTLTEKRLIQTSGGRSIFSVLITQDIAVIPMLALLPLLALGGPGILIAPDGSIQRGAVEHHDDHATLSLIEGLPAWGVTLVTAGAVVAIILAGIFLTLP